MDAELQDWIQTLEAAWSKPDGFLGQLREGIFNQQKGADFVALLNEIKLPKEESSIDKRLVALLWYIPIFLGWQKQRVADKGGDTMAVERLSNQVQGIMEQILGVP